MRPRHRPTQFGLKIFINDDYRSTKTIISKLNLDFSLKLADALVSATSAWFFDNYGY